MYWFPISLPSYYFILFITKRRIDTVDHRIAYTQQKAWWINVIFSIHHHHLLSERTSWVPPLISPKNLSQSIMSGLSKKIQFRLNEITKSFEISSDDVDSLGCPRTKRRSVEAPKCGMLINFTSKNETTSRLWKRTRAMKRRGRIVSCPNNNDQTAVQQRGRGIYHKFVSIEKKQQLNLYLSDNLSNNQVERGNLSLDFVKRNHIDRLNVTLKLLDLFLDVIDRNLLILDNANDLQLFNSVANRNLLAWRRNSRILKQVSVLLPPHTKPSISIDLTKSAIS